MTMIEAADIDRLNLSGPTKTKDEQIATQADIIKALWVQLAAAKKQNAHAQPYIAELKAERAALLAQLTQKAKAEWIFNDD